MNSSDLSSQTDNNLICEAVGCYARATTKVAVRLGSGGAILLYLCDNCKHRFSPQPPERRASETGGHLC